MPYPGLLHPSLCPCNSTADPYLLRKQADTVLAQALWGLWVLVRTRHLWALWASLAGMGFDSKHDFTPPAILLGLPLCPWTWDTSSQSLQCVQLPLQRQHHVATRMPQASTFPWVRNIPVKHSMKAWCLCCLSSLSVFACSGIACWRSGQDGWRACLQRCVS